MSARRPAIASWVDTGRRTPPTTLDRLADLRALSADIAAGRRPPPALAAWFTRAVAELGAQLADGGRPNLHKLLGLPDRSPRQWRRSLARRERNCAVIRIMSHLAELTPWQRATALVELLENPDAECPPGARGDLAALRAGIYGRPPESVWTYHRIARRAN